MAWSSKGMEVVVLKCEVQKYAKLCFDEPGANRGFS